MILISFIVFASLWKSLRDLVEEEKDEEETDDKKNLCFTLSNPLLLLDAFREGFEVYRKTIWKFLSLSICTRIHSNPGSNWILRTGGRIKSSMRRMEYKLLELEGGEMIEKLSNSSPHQKKEIN